MTPPLRNTLRGAFRTGAFAALTTAELNLNVTHFELLARQAELDFATASGKLPAAIGVLSP